MRKFIGFLFCWAFNLGMWLLACQAGDDWRNTAFFLLGALCAYVNSAIIDIVNYRI